MPSDSQFTIYLTDPNGSDIAQRELRNEYVVEVQLQSASRANIALIYNAWSDPETPVIGTLEFEHMEP